MTFLPFQIATGILYPQLLLIYFIRKLPIKWFFNLRMHIDGIDRPYYAYGIYQAAVEAKALNISKISVYEFGVAAGTGLIMLEKLSEQIARITGVAIDVYGFDAGTGMPGALDYRDVPYIWRRGFYKMDVEALRKKLTNTTKLVLGNVKKTIPKFTKSNVAPIGFIAFDLDYYTSTKDAFRIFDAPDKKMLPRVFCYFDDIVGTDEEIFCEYVGELLAIREFNKAHRLKKIAKVNGLFHKRAIKSTWSDMIYVMHNFAHKSYNSYIYHQKDRQSRLS